MYCSVREQIPEFLSEQIVYCDNLIVQRKQKTCLILTKQLQFYEFRQKQLLHALDLSSSCLRCVSQQLTNYKGPRGKWLPATIGDAADDDEHDTQVGEKVPDENVSGTKGKEQPAKVKQPPPVISFGKYIYQHLNVTKFYVLVRCWDALVVLLRSSAGGAYQMVREYRNVVDFKLVHGRLKFHALVQFEFLNGESAQTDFNEVELSEPVESYAVNRKEFKHLLERVQRAQSELQMHKCETHYEMDRLLNSQAFGENYRRSLNLNEKQVLARCGDVWYRFTSAQDDLVIGVPLINNCVRPSLRTLKNLRPLIDPLTMRSGRGIRYTWRLYQLRLSFESLESLETFFQSEDADILHPNVWGEIATGDLPPETYAVLLVKIHLQDLLKLQRASLYVSFNTTTDFGLSNTNRRPKKTYQFDHQIFIKELDFPKILHSRQELAVNFHSDRFLQQDLLATTFTSFEVKLCITFKSHNDMEIFERVLARKFDFEQISRPPVAEPTKFMDDDKEADLDTKFRMSLDNNEVPRPLTPDAEQGAHNCPDMNTNFLKSNSLYFNRQPNSMFYAAMALRQSSQSMECSSQEDDLKCLWKFYVRDLEKGFLLVKLLFEDLLLHECNVEHVMYVDEDEGTPSVTSLEFQSALKQELHRLSELMELHKAGKDISRKLQELFKAQFQTDRIARHVLPE